MLIGEVVKFHQTKMCKASKNRDSLFGTVIDGSTSMNNRLLGSKHMGGQETSANKIANNSWSRHILALSGPSCGDYQFARNAACRKCGGPKPGVSQALMVFKKTLVEKR